MADDQTQTVDPSDQQAALVQQLLRQTLTGTAAQPQEPPHSGDNRTWGSLLGQALVGGAGPGSTDAANEQAGLRALQQVGLGMMSGSDYSQARHSLGSIVAGAIGGAQESNAAQNAAQLDYQTKQQELQLGRLKEALPLLTMLQTLQQQKALRGLPSSLGATAPGANVNIGAVGGNTYEAAIGGHEGLGPDPRLPSTVGGFRPDTWQGFVTANPDLFKGMTPEQAAAARSDPTLNARGISWLAQQNADTLTKAGVTPSGPALGVAHYIGAGAAAKALQAPDNAPVRDFVSADAIKYNPELATMTVGQLKQRYASTPAPAFLGGPKPGAAPPAPATAQTPPAASTAPPAPVVGKGAPIPAGRPTGPPIITDQPAAGSATVAGPPGVATVGQPLPPSPEVAGNVNAIIGGMTGAGANATTLAPGPGTTAPAAPLATQAQVQPQPPPITPPPVVPAPDTGPPQFVYKPNVDLTPAEKQQFDITNRSYENSIRTALTNEDRLKAEATLQQSVAKQAEVLAARRAEDFRQQQADHDKAVDAYHKTQEFNRTQAAERDKAAQAQRDTLAVKEAEGAQTRLTNKEAVFNQANQKGLESEASEQANAHGVVGQLEGFRSISDNVGQPGWMQTTKWPGSDQSIAEKLQQTGVVKLDDTAGVQLLRGGITNLVKTLRAGMPMGSLSDRDLNFIERMGPTEWMDPDTRSAAVGYLQQAYRANEQFHRDVQREMSRGKNYGDALDAVSARQKPFVPQVPADLTAHWDDKTGNWKQQREDWAEREDVHPGTLIHMANGKIVVVKRPQGSQ